MRGNAYRHSPNRNPPIRLEWREGPHKGREVIYAAGQNAGLMHINMADSLVPVPRMSLAPDSPMVTRTSRHPITASPAAFTMRSDRHTSSGTVEPSGGAIRVGAVHIGSPRATQKRSAPSQPALPTPIYSLTRVGSTSSVARQSPGDSSRRFRKSSTR